MAVSYTEALGGVFGALIALGIVLVIGLVFLWLGLRSHERVLLAEIRSSYQRTQEMLVDIRAQQSRWEQAQASQVEASYAFKQAAQSLESFVTGVMPLIKGVENAKKSNG